MKKLFLSASLTLFMSFLAFGQTVKNVQARVDGNQVYISYDLISGTQGQKFNVELRSSIDNFDKPLTEVSGDVGPDQEAGLGKTIIWNAIGEVGNFSGSVSFEITSIVTFSPLAITNPKKGSSVKLGKSLDVEWHGGEKGRNLKMAILQGGNQLTEIPNVGSSGNYSWNVPKSMGKADNYQIKLFDPSKPNDAAMSAEFKLKKTSVLVYILPGVVVAGAAAFFLMSGNGGGSDCTDICNPSCPNYNPVDPSCVVATEQLASPPPPPGGGN